MLVLSRKNGEQLLIGDDIVITIVRIGQGAVRIGVDAPDSMNIVRAELVPAATPVIEGAEHAAV